MPMLMEIHKVRAFDTLFKEEGVEEEDITKAFLKLKLAQTDEFKTMVANTKEAVNKKIADFMNQAKAQHAARQAAMGGGTNF